MGTYLFIRLLICRNNIFIVSFITRTPRLLFLFLFGFFFFWVAPVHAATYTVTNTNDSGAGSLRQAVLDANTNLGLDTINFDVGISGGTITLATVLDAFTEEVIVDGTTLTNVQAGPDITIVGDTSMLFILGFNNAENDNVVKGVAVNGGYYGIYAVNTEGLVIGGSVTGEGNWIDDCANGGIKIEDTIATTIRGNISGGTTGNAVGIFATTGNVDLIIGGTGANEGNISVNNSAEGIVVWQGENTSILGNYVGVEADGETAAPNGAVGISTADVMDGLTIGGTVAGSKNVISGNNGSGISIGVGATNVVIQGNYIGTNADGDAALPNLGFGILANSAVTIGGTAAGAGNVIAGGNGADIQLQDAGATLSVANVLGSTVQGNILGLNAAGNAILDGYEGSGIFIYNSNNTIGGSASGARNIISGHEGTGVVILGNYAIAENNVIQGNYIGTDITGNVDLGNVGHGVYMNEGARESVIGGTGAGEGNLISGNTGHGILLESTSGDGTTIEGNTIGMNADLDTGMPNDTWGVIILSDDNVVGGDTSASRNIISGNGAGGGVAIAGSGSDNIIKNNYIGTVTGTDTFGNSGSGILVAGSASGTIIGGVGDGNIIVDNNAHGIFMSETTVTGTVVQGNYIGVDATGNAVLGNGQIGLYAQEASVIGGTGAGEGNIISGNEAEGVILAGNGGSTVQGNLIGVDVDGDTDFGNVSDGVQIVSSGNTVGGNTSAARNIISGNNRHGVLILGAVVAEDNVIIGNYIGVGSDGSVDLGNTSYGVHIAAVDAANNTIGGTAAGYGNVISGNGESGIDIEDDGGSQTIVGNYIGTNAAGTAAVANGGAGIRMNSDNNTIGGTTTASRNIISGNASAGVILFNNATGNTFQNNYIGTNAAGNAAIANTNEGVYITDASTGNFIGVAGFGNVISGNGTRALWLNGDTTDSNSIQANIIGFAADGTTALANGAVGILILSGDNNSIGTINTPSARNIIGNSIAEPGIYLTAGANGNTVVNNYVGVAGDGTTVAANASAGIQIQDTAASNTIGGAATGAGNTIAAVAGDACVHISWDAGDFNTIRHNSCLNEGATIMNIMRDGTSNENVDAPTVTAGTSTTSYVAGTATGNTTVDVFVDGSFTISINVNGMGEWSYPLATASGSEISAAMTNGNGSTSATTTPQVTVVDDVTVPTVSSLDPADNETGASATGDMIVTFSEAVTVGSGNILVKRVSTGDTVETIVVTDGAKVTGTGTTIITINPATSLSSGVEYAIQIDATAFDDYSGNGFAGIADLTTWSFTIASRNGGGGSSDTSWTAEKTITITAPTEDTEVPGGTTLRVTWDYTGVVPYVSVYLSIDGGDTWTLVREDVSNNQSTTITVPDEATDEAKVKVEGTDLAVTLATDTSDAFMITATAGGSDDDDDSGSAYEGDLVKLEDDGDAATQGDSSVYFVGNDGKRHVFTNPAVYFSWYEDFDDVIEISAEDMAGIQLGYNVTYKPGVTMVKFQVSPKIYVVDWDHTLRYVTSESMASELYGSDWNTEDVDDISDVFFTNYTIGAALEDAEDYDRDDFENVETPDQIFVY